MKIGTLTFHWATNYGAVLQAYALQKHLLQNGYETEIINYIPLKLIIIQFIMRLKKLQFEEFRKENQIRKFRKSFMKLSKTTFYSNHSLVKKCQEYDIYICGSDQIWNEWFMMSAERKPTLSYYLNFVQDDKTRISYATSFGSETLSEAACKLIKPELSKFKSIGVREKTGQNMLNILGLHATLVADPTLLLTRKTYDQIIESSEIKHKYSLFSYILHDGQTIAHEIVEYIYANQYQQKSLKKYNQEPISVPEWLYNIKYSDFVITNSFHGVIFSLIYHKPFIVVLVESSKMNDRINTLLTEVELIDRIQGKFDPAQVNILSSKQINWDQVDVQLQKMRDISFTYINDGLV